MSARLTLTEIKKRVRNNVTVLSNTYVVGEKLLCECEKGHRWQATANKLVYKQTGCPYCRGKVKLTLEKVRQRLNNVNPNIKILSNSYVNNSTPLDCECEKGHRWQASVANLLHRQTGCPYCVGNAQLTLEKVRQRLSIINPNIKILNSNYVNSLSSLDCECEKGHKWQATANSLINNQTGCPYCAKKANLTLNQIKQRLSIINPTIKVLNEIYEVGKKLLCECEKGHRWQAYMVNLLVRKSGCPHCAGNAKLTLEKVKQQLSIINPDIKILSDSYTNNATPLDCECEKGHKWQATANALISRQTGCPKCARIQTKSEAKVQELLELNGVEFITNDRQILNGKELDFYIPSAKLAIEVNGEFWHSSAQERITKNYHLEKTLECEAQGIKLLQFWDFNELQLKWQICESMILNALNKTSNRLYARQCIAKEISSKEGKKFCDLNHIQGNKGASIYLALEHNSKIVSVMSFGKSRFNKNVEWELLRFCNLTSYSVVGSASKLLKYFELNYNPKSLISYADRRRSSALSNVYKELNFKLLRNAEPNYFYFKPRDLKLFSRQTFQRHKLEKYFGKSFDSKLTEGQIMQDEGFLRLYDCGNLVYVKDYEQGV